MGNGTGQIGSLPTYSWLQQAYASTGNEIAAVLLPLIQYAASYQAIEGGNLSSNGASVGVAESVEGLPVFALLSWGPTCQLARGGGGNKVPLGGDGLQRYNDEKQQLLSGDYLSSDSCRAFFGSDQIRLSYYGQLPAGIINQVPYDGLQSNISWYDAGFLSARDLNNPVKVSIFKGAPVCGQFVSYRGVKGTVSVTSRVAAAAQIHPPAGGGASDVYINTKRLKDLSQATIAHEALHNITGMYDSPVPGTPVKGDLETLLGLDPTRDCPVGSICVSNVLKTKGCVGAN